MLTEHTPLTAARGIFNKSINQNASLIGGGYERFTTKTLQMGGTRQGYETYRYEINK